MNDYQQLRLDLTPCSETATDILAAMLADVGYESFVPDASGLTAFIPAPSYDAAAVDAVIADFPFPDTDIACTATYVEGRDWNAEWERNYFKPIVVGVDAPGNDTESVVIHSSFHTDIPHAKYDIVIDPKMAFGTGHHATTSLILRQLLAMPMEGLTVMDMGTGTGILAILAAMRGAKRVDAIEIDEFAYTNALENIALNHHSEIDIALGDASALPAQPTYDLFIANINRNVITADIPRYARATKPGATMLLSGFYVDDIPVIEAAATPLQLTLASSTELDRWACVKLIMN